MGRLRWLHAVVSGAERALDPDPWRQAADPKTWLLTRKAPRRFPDMEALRALHASLQSSSGAQPVLLNEIAIESDDDFQRAIAPTISGSGQDRGRVQISAGSPPPLSIGAGTWAIWVHGPGQADGPTRVDADPQKPGLGRYLANQLDAHTVDYTWSERRGRAPVVPPLNATEAYQNAATSMAVRRAARIGLIGAVLGGVLGSIGGVVASILWGSPN